LIIEKEPYLLADAVCGTAAARPQAAVGDHAGIGHKAING
jgi:hypothetical protein